LEGYFLHFGGVDGEVEHLVGVIEGVFVRDRDAVSDRGVGGWCSF